MNVLGKQRFLVLMVVASAFPAWLVAETIVFKDGESQDGKILSRDEKFITLEYKKFGVTIKKNIPLTNIKSIDGKAVSGQPGEPNPSEDKPSAKLSQPTTTEPNKPSTPNGKGGTLTKPMGTAPNELTQEALGLFSRGLRSKATESLEKVFEANPKLSEEILSTEKKGWQDFYHETGATFRLRGATEDKDVALLLAIAKYAHETGIGVAAKRSLLTVQQLDPNNEEVLKLSKAWGIRLTAPVSLNLLPSMTQSIFLNQLTDEGHTIEPRRNARFLSLPLRYDSGSIGLSLSRSSVEVYLDEKKKADRRGFAELADANVILPSGSDPIWEKIELAAPKKSRRRADSDSSLVAEDELSDLPVVAELWNLIAPRGVDLQPGVERMKRDTRRPTGFASAVVQIPTDVKTIWFQYGDRPRQEIDLDWVEQAHRPVDQMAAADLTVALAKLEAILDSGSDPMAELALAMLLNWRSKASSLDTASAGERMNLILVRVLGSQKSGLVEIAWEALVSSSAIDEDLKKLLATKAREETLLGLVEVARETLAASKTVKEGAVEGDDPSETTPTTEVEIGSDLPISGANRNVFELLAAVGQSPHQAVANKVVDVLLADGTRQSVSVLAVPSPLQVIARSRLASLDDEALKRAIFLMLLTSSEPKDLALLVAPAQGVKLVVDKPTHPLLAVVQKLKDNPSRAAYVLILKTADLSPVLESNEALGVFQALTATTVDLKVRTSALNLLLSGWSPNDKRLTFPAGVDPIPNQAVEGLLTPLIRDESPDIFMPACTALIKHGQIKSALDGVKQLDGITREKLVQTVAKDRSLMTGNHLLMFLAGLIGDRDASTIACVTLAEVMQATPDRWKWIQDVKRYLKWEDVNALAGGGTDVATAAMKVLRNTAGVGTAEQDELREINDPQNRRTKLLEINDRHQKEPSGGYGCVVMAEVMIPVTAEPESGQVPADMETWRWLGQQRLELGGLKITTPPAQKDQPPSPSTVALGDQNLSAPIEAGRVSPTARIIPLKASLLLKAALKSAAEAKGNDQAAEIAKKIGDDVLPKDAVVTLKHHQMGTWIGELTFTRSGTAGEQLDENNVSIGLMAGGLKPYMSKITVVLEPVF